MRLKPLLPVAIVAVAALSLYWVWPKPTKPAFESIERKTQSNTTESSAENPRPSSRPLASNSGRFIQGISIDNQAVPVANADILHRIISIPSDQECFSFEDMQFELNETTELIASDEEGLFTLPLDWPDVSSDNPDNNSNNHTDNNTDNNPHNNTHNNTHNNHCLIVSASKQGFMTTTVALPIAMENLPNLVELELLRNRSIQGTVVAPDNNPVPSSQVVAWQPLDSSEASNICQPADNQSAIDEQTKIEANTDNAGQFIFDIALENDYCVQAFHANWSRSVAHLLSSNNKADALRLQLLQPLQLSGTVRDLDDRAVSGLTVQATGTAALARQQTATTNANGEFVFNTLESDTYQLSTPNGRYHIAEPNTVLINADKPQEPLAITVFPVTQLRGRVMNSAGNPVAKVEVSTRSPFTSDQAAASALSDSGGYFELESLHRSKSAQENFKMATEFVPSASGVPFAGNVCVDFYHPSHGRQLMALAATDDTLDMGEVYLQQPALQVEGRVLNHRNEPVKATLIFTNTSAQESKALEVRLPRCEDSSLNRKVSTGQDGHFQLNLDEAGNYSVEVQTDKYKTRKVDVEIQGSLNGLDIKLN